jgi:hypothetical protein
MSNKDDLYMVGNLIKLSTTFINNTFPDSNIQLVETKFNRNCSRIPDYAITSMWNRYIS